MLNIHNIEYYLPENIITNDELARLNPDWDMDSIQNWTGVSKRFYAKSNQTALDLAFISSEKLLEDIEVSRDQIDGLIFCTQSNDHIMPPNSTILHGLLKLSEDVFSFDFNLACSGFIYGLFIANGLIETNVAKNILLINADTYSKYVNDKDRSTKVLFGDAASTSILRKSTNRKGLIDIICSTSGINFDKIIVPAGGTRKPKSNKTNILKKDQNGNLRSDENLQMNGLAVYSFVNTKVPKQINKLLSRNKINIDEIDLFVFHQANKLVLESLTKILKIDTKKVFINIDKVSNTVSASIPIALKDAQEEGKIKDGYKVLCSGFGAGLSWGTCILQF